MALPRIAALALAASLTSGCGVFLESRRVEVGPFGENTAKLVSDVNPTEGGQQVLFIRPYLPVPSGPRLRDEWAAFQVVLRAAVEYATQVVSISESSLEDRVKARELAAYLDGPFRASLQREQGLSRLDGAPLDRLVGKVRSSEDLLAALRAAQPAAEELLQLADTHARRIRDLQDAFSAEVAVKIDQAYSRLVANLHELEALQQQAMETYGLVGRARLGSAEALAAARDRDPGVRQALGKEPLPGLQAFEAAESQLADRLARLDKLLVQIVPEIDLYVRTRAELNRIVELSDRNATRGRLAMIAFARSHRNLAAGLPVPPELDVLGALKSSAMSAASRVVP